MEHFISILVLFTGIFLVNYSSALTCYSFDGVSYPDQQICPGTSQCCGVSANCTTNRLCEKEGERQGTLVRGPCAVHPWDSTVCATICLYDEQPQGGVFPRATTCEDGSFCCDNDSACCAKGRGVFLDRAGNIIESSTQVSSSTKTTSIASSSSVPASTSITSTTSTPSPSSSTSTPSNSSNSLPQGAKIGLGVGVTFGAIVILMLATIAWFLWKRNQPPKPDPSAPYTYTPYESPPLHSAAHTTQQLIIKDNEAYHYSHELPSSSPQELEAPKAQTA